MIDNDNLHRLRIAAEKKTGERDYWLSELAGEPGKSGFPAHYKGGEKGKQLTDKERVEFEFSEELSSHLLKSSAGSDVRLHILLAAGVSLLIYKYTGSGDIIVGVPIYKVETGEELINTVLPLRSRLEETMTFKQLVLQVKETMARANENRNYPIEMMAEQLNMPVGDEDFPLFDVAVLVETIHDKKYLDRVNPNVIFSFSGNNDRTASYVEYDALRYNRKEIEGIINHFKNLLQTVLSNADLKAAEINILTEEEMRQLLVDFNDTSVSYPIDKTIHELFEKQAARSPDKIAVVGNGSLTYL